MADDVQLVATKDLIDAACGIALMIPLEDVQALADEFGRMESIMPIIDPTVYMKVRSNLPGHKEACEAFLAFGRRRQELMEVPYG